MSRKPKTELTPSQKNKRHDHKMYALGFRRRWVHVSIEPFVRKVYDKVLKKAKKDDQA